MAKQRKIEGRQTAEKDEKYITIQTGLPSDRFSEQKQIVSSDEMGVTEKSIPENVTNDKIDAAKKLKSKIKIRPDVSVDTLEGKQVGGVPLAVDTGLRNVAGARSMSPADDMSRTPYSSGKYRPTTAYGKKRSEDLFELDNAAIEQVVPEVEDTPDLKAAPDSTFVYNGRQQFKQTRQKKNFSFVDPADSTNRIKVPQQLLNEASVDFVTVNKVAYATGQVVNPIDESNGSVNSIPATADYPTVSNGSAVVEQDVLHKGNYLPKALRLKVQNGHITKISIDEDRFIAAADPVTRDECNHNWQVDANNIAKTMVKIQTELGRETSEKWTPLAYVINEPYQYNTLLHDIEATMGANMATAYRAAVSSLAYQRNIIKKDGINAQRNAVKMIVEGYAGVMANNDRDNISDLSMDTIFNKSVYRKGAATAIIEMFDSTKKYQTKADLLGMQRSFGLHLSQADNNLAPLRCKKDFIKSLDKLHMFSTVDGSYNPYLPIYQTREIKVINPISLNYFLRDWKNPALFDSPDYTDITRDQTTGTRAQYVYQYNDLRNNTYNTRVQMPMLEGLILWLLKHEGAVVSTFGNDSNDIVIPWTFNFQSPSLLQFMLCSAAQDINYERNICFRDVLFAGEQATYIWDDLAPLKDVDPLYSSQLHIGKYDEPLTLGKLAPDTVIREFFSDHKQLARHVSGAVEYFEPWYFSEKSLNRSGYTINRGYRDGDHPFHMSFPSIKDGVRHEYIDVIKSMDVKDVALSLDRKMTFLPFVTVTEYQDSNSRKLFDVYSPCLASADASKLSLYALRYDLNSDGRVYSHYNLDSGRNLDMLAKGMYCIPKEIGIVDDDYTGISVITNVSKVGDNTVIVSFNEDFDETDTSGINTKFYNGGIAKWVTSYRVEAESNDTSAIDRSAALTSTFYNFFAANSSDFDVINQKFIKKTGLVVTRAYRNGAQVRLPAVFNIDSTNVPSISNANTVSDADYVWTVLQRFMQPVNPFANAFALSSSATPNDPFEVSFWFGVCGFLSADYTQHVLERLSVFDQLGFDYTEDENRVTSPILR